MSSDIALVWSNVLLRADFAMAGPDLMLDAGLQTALTVSYLTDAQALPGDVLPDDDGPRGWWGDAYDDYKIGSRLWLLRRAVLTQTTLNLAQDYAMEATQWMVDDGVIGSRSVVATAVTINRMNLATTLLQKGNKKTYDVVWRGLQGQ